MKTINAIITVAILTIASTSFAGSKCSHMMSTQGNSLLQNTVATSSVVAQGTQTATATVSAQAVK